MIDSSILIETSDDSIPDTGGMSQNHRFDDDIVMKSMDSVMNEMNNWKSMLVTVIFTGYSLKRWVTSDWIMKLHEMTIPVFETGFVIKGGIAKCMFCIPEQFGNCTDAIH